MAEWEALPAEERDGHTAIWEAKVEAAAGRRGSAKAAAKRRLRKRPAAAVDEPVVVPAQATAPSAGDGLGDGDGAASEMQIALAAHPFRDPCQWHLGSKADELAVVLSSPQLRDDRTQCDLSTEPIISPGVFAEMNPKGSQSERAAIQALFNYCPGLAKAEGVVPKSLRWSPPRIQGGRGLQNATDLVRPWDCSGAFIVLGRDSWRRDRTFIIGFIVLGP
jgi:hypothetical protein